MIDTKDWCILVTKSGVKKLIDTTSGFQIDMKFKMINL